MPGRTLESTEGVAASLITGRKGEVGLKGKASGCTNQNGPFLPAEVGEN